jgi:hypothetical protein
LRGIPGIIITLTSGAAPGVIESYDTFDDIAEGVVDARDFKCGRQASRSTASSLRRSPFPQTEE